MTTVDIISPIDGRVVASRALASDEQIQAALLAAQKAQLQWRHTSLDERLALIRKGIAALQSKQDEIAQEITLQMGRPIRYTPNEIKGFVERGNHMSDIAAACLADEMLPEKSGFTRFIRRDPLGVGFIVAPWNYPLLTAVNSVAPSLLAGNAVILKHSAQTMLCSERIVQALNSAGLPAGLCQFLHLSHSQTTMVIRNAITSYVTFTGSVAGGQSMETAAVGRFIPVGLELGGNDPGYVRADANLAHAVETLVDGAFFNSGQSCCGIQRVYVARNLFDDFVQQAVQLTEQYVLGNSLDTNTTLGPVVSTHAAQEIRSICAAAVKAGAKQLVNLSKFALDDGHGAYLAPQVFVNVNHQMALMNDECFGPVLGIMPVDSDEQALSLMNDSPYGLTAAVFTQDQEAALRLGSALQTGTVFMNRCDYLDPALPWTGVKNTGRGISLSRLGYDQLTRAKGFHLKTQI